ncbi:DUF1801 domain-containing protein [Ascidiimonas aurantiaca]|uniref:DUF1801 domain-containing protein n=1 Tax=Ascidiimonas aurantiaca TaxID=1685432 RepID=UPI0030EBBBEB
MPKFQPISFRTTEALFDYLPTQELEVLLFLRDLILESIPGVQEKIAYNVPFYYKFRRILYLWPGAVPWGKVPEGSVQVGFCDGYLLDNTVSFLEKGNRKQIRSVSFQKINEIDVPLLKSYIFQAVALDASKRKP